MTPELMGESVILGILSVLIIIGNILVLVIFGRGPRKLTNYLIINLAVADFLVGAVVIPLYLSVGSGLVSTASSAFDAISIFDVMFGCESIYCLCMVSIERMIAIQYPLYYRKMTRTPILVAILLSWILSAGIAWYRVIYGLVAWFRYSIFLIIYTLPVVVIVVCYGIVFRASRRRMSSNATYLRNNMKTAKMILIIIGLFLATWAPFFALNIYITFCSKPCAEISVRYVVPIKILHYSNSIMNVFVYAANMATFRNSLKEIASLFSACSRSKWLLSHRYPETNSPNAHENNPEAQGGGLIMEKEKEPQPPPPRSDSNISLDCLPSPDGQDMLADNSKEMPFQLKES